MNKSLFQKILISVLLFIALFSVLGFFILPPILKSVLTKELSRALNREVSIRKIKVNPYVLSLTAMGLRLKRGKKYQKKNYSFL
ncbi:MAG: hypothetical protein N2513_07995 [Deltaproteobacteria bacterium]|nr:hypothetical protein [Deltaproteobacteria bacterium]